MSASLQSSETPTELEATLQELLSSGKYEEAKIIISDDKFHHILNSQTSGVISMLINHINRITFDNNYALFDCCESLIYQIAELSQPDDSLIDFLEHIEKNDEFLFPVMLKALKISIFRIADKQECALAWCLNAIIGCINSIPQTEDLKLEGDECLIQENDDSARRIIDAYKHVLDFSEALFPLIAGERKHFDFNDGANNLLVFHIKLLGRPLANYALECHNVKGEFRILAERIIGIICKFKVDLTHFLYFVSPYNANKAITVTDVVDMDFNNLSLGVLYYLIFKEEVGLDNISYVYHPFFMLENLTTLVLSMLQIEHSKIQNKGLHLLDCILQKTSDFSLDFNRMNCELFGSLSECLARIMIYSNVKENRILAVPLFEKLVKKFNSDGRYYILYNIQSKVTHPGFIGYMITITKEFVNRTLNDRNPMDLKYFTGTNLCNILKKYCTLHKGAESDLIELYDQIISSLNFVIFLLIRDKENVSGFYEFIPAFEKDYLEPLKTGLTLSTAHYELQKTELKNALSDDKLEVTVGGVQLPALPNEQKLGVIETALMNFDLIRNIVARLEECLRDFRMAYTVHIST